MAGVHTTFHNGVISDMVRIGWDNRDFNKKLPLYLLNKLWRNSARQRIPDLFRFENEVIFIGEVVSTSPISKDKYTDYAELAFLLDDIGVVAVLIEFDRFGKILGEYDLLSMFHGINKGQDIRDILLEAKREGDDSLLELMNDD